MPMFLRLNQIYVKRIPKNVIKFSKKVTLLSYFYWIFGWFYITNNDRIIRQNAQFTAIGIKFGPKNGDKFFN